ncbi:MAG: acetyl-CoA carboxylase, carboxyltransferase subunit beta [Bacteroidia bacterium]|nr:acetyl-CoA carboxylase, carboxyltransferase subunit beta [Bacteroidia bacterium]
MSWYKRISENILTPTSEKKEVPDGIWTQCPGCKTAISTKTIHKNAYVCTTCNHHLQIGSREYFEILFDENEFTEMDANMISADPLEFKDTKAYPDRLIDSIKKTKLKDAVRTAHGKSNGLDLVVVCMDFSFIGGSMGSVVGEKICNAVKFCIENRFPLLIISRSGGARMMEGALSLMQMAKISANLALLSQNGLPYISLMTDPTTGGVTASYAMLGDLNIAEPNALIGFAGPRVIKETIGQNLPEGFQRSEFLLEHGFLDFIIDRKDLKDKLSSLLKIMQKLPSGE